MSQQLAVFKASQGYFIAPLGFVGDTTADRLVQRVSPFYVDQQRAYDALDEKQREYDEANA